MSNILKFTYSFILVSSVLTVFFLTGAPTIFSQSSPDGTIIHLNVNNCNNNNICEPLLGENYQGCPLDCNASSTPTSTPSTAPGGRQSLIQNPNQPPQIFNVSVTVDKDLNALIRWESYPSTVGYLSWGRNTDTKDGTIAEISFQTEHSVQLASLQPNTRYYFLIQFIDQAGRSAYSNIYSFITPPSSAISSPVSILTPQPLVVTPFSILRSSTTPPYSGIVNLGGKELQGLDPWELYWADYFVAYFFGFLNYLFFLLIHI